MINRIVITFTLMMSLTGSLLGQDSSDQIRRPKAAQGIMLGELTDTSVLAQVRLTATRKEVDRDVPGSIGFVRFLCVEDGRDIGTPLPMTVLCLPRPFVITSCELTSRG